MTIPYAFEGPYAQCYADLAGAMDPRHVFIVHEVLKAWPFRNALELGSYNGASSTAFVEAINAGASLNATLCDIYARPNLWDVVRNCKHTGRVRVTKDPSWDVLASFEHYDFVLVDAYHDLQSVQNELRVLLARRPLCIMAHDTSATANGHRLCEGAAMLKKTLTELPGYFGLPYYRCIEDCRKREGERTQRGLFLATTNDQLFRAARRVFEEWTAD